ncbi:MAG: dienelactone hydrolase family protein [Alphaproteobacteria bacterium]|nr:dienelactone hydrolase family protein [Alphaproteobacteria bacterium]
MAIFMALGLLCLHGFDVRAQGARESVVWTPGNPSPVGNYTDAFAKQVMSVPVGEQDVYMTYFLLAPQKPWPEGVKFPLILLMHGAGGWAQGGYYLLDQNVRLEYPAFVVVPALPRGVPWAQPGGMRPGYALPAAVSLIQKISRVYPVDTSRLYAVGCSMGGIGAYGAARYYPDVFAAAVPVAGAWNPKEGKAMTGIPVAAFHGAKDRSISPASSKETISAIRAAGGQATYTEFSGMGHECDSALVYTDALWQWLFQQQKN